MTRWRPDLALDHLTEALEAEILAAPEPELDGLVRESAAQPGLEALRTLVAGALERADEGVILPPEVHARPPSLRRP